MYFDVDQNVEMPKAGIENAFASVAREISMRRGLVIAMSNEVLLFSAPFWRLYGFPRLPMGVSHGVLQVITMDGVQLVRIRISLLWLRVSIAAIVLLLMVSVIIPGLGTKAYLWAFFLTSIIAGLILYVLSVIEARRDFTRMFHSGERPADRVSSRW